MKHVVIQFDCEGLEELKELLDKYQKLIDSILELAALGISEKLLDDLIQAITPKELNQ